MKDLQISLEKRYATKGNMERIAHLTPGARTAVFAIELQHPLIRKTRGIFRRVLPFYLYDHSAFGRKETIGFLILLWHLWSLESHGHAQSIDGSRKSLPRGYLGKLLLLSVILLPILVFIHESTILLFVPAHALLTHSMIRLDPSRNVMQRLLFPVLICLPAILAFAVVIGNPPREVSPRKLRV